MTRGLAFSFAVTLLSQSALGSDAGCKTNPHLTGKCYMMRGRVVMSADIGPVLDADSGKKRLIIRSAPGSEWDMPTSVGNALLANLQAGLRGIYEVCPIPTQPSQFPPESTHYVCIEKASHASIIH